MSCLVLFLPVPYAGIIVDLRFIHKFVNLANLSVCPVVFSTKMFAADPESCNLHESDSKVQHIPQMLNQIEIWAIWRTRQHLQLLAMFLKQILNNICSVARCIILLKEAVVFRKTHCYGVVHIV